MPTFYGVWAGRKPGVYTNWTDCKAQVDRFPCAKFSKLKATSHSEALAEFKASPNHESGSPAVRPTPNTTPTAQIASTPAVATETLTVDGASNGRTCEYQGVWHPSGKKAFASKVFKGGTNNIAEFLALVAAVKYLKEHKKPLSVYTDSTTAMAWFKHKKANTTASSTGKLTPELLLLLQEAELFLQTDPQIASVVLLKWPTREWGEIPADFGRK